VYFDHNNLLFPRPNMLTSLLRSLRCMKSKNAARVQFSASSYSGNLSRIVPFLRHCDTVVGYLRFFAFLPTNYRLRPSQGVLPMAYRTKFTRTSQTDALNQHPHAAMHRNAAIFDHSDAARRAVGDVAPLMFLLQLTSS